MPTFKKQDTVKHVISDTTGIVLDIFTRFDKEYLLVYSGKKRRYITDCPKEFEMVKQFETMNDSIWEELLKDCLINWPKRKNDGRKTMTLENMKAWVISAYPGEKWKAKVEKMAHDQIVSLYYSLVKQGKIKGA